VQHPHWNQHYDAVSVRRPTRFSRYCTKQHVRPDDVLIELGCGNGRDGLMLSQRVSRYIGVDVCGAAIDVFAKCATNAPLSDRQPHLLRTDFTAMDFNTFAPEATRLAIYSRFSLHSITYAEQARLLDHMSNIREPRWVFMVEARTIHDDLYGVGRCVGLHEFETDHYRRFIDPEVFLETVSARFRVDYFEVSDTFAPYKNERPIVMRAVFRHASKDRRSRQGV
jgi:tellurite methyltransferase